LYEGDDPCGAVTQYQAAEAIAALDEAAARGYSQSYQECYPATATIDPASLITPTLETPIVEPPPVATTEVVPPTEITPVVTEITPTE